VQTSVSGYRFVRKPLIVREECWLPAVSGTLLAGRSTSTSGCEDPRISPRVLQWQAVPFGAPGDRMPNGFNVRSNNCFKKSGTYRTPGKDTCDRGTASSSPVRLLSARMST
jgi:hypothetical protein